MPARGGTVASLGRTIAVGVQPCASELAEIAKGEKSQAPPALRPCNGLGYWIRIGTTYPNPFFAEIERKLT